MRILIAGANGKIGRRLTTRLAAEGHTPLCIIRDGAQADAVRERGGEPLVADLAGDVEGLVANVDAVVFTAGGGPGSSPESKRTIDYGACARLADAAVSAGVERFVVVSSMHVDQPEAWTEKMTPYFEAKRDADDHVRGLDLEWTIVRPGGLTDDEGAGLVRISESLPSGQVTRDDVAHVVAACLVGPEAEVTIRRTVDLTGGDDPVDVALAALA